MKKFIYKFSFIFTLIFIFSSCEEEKIVFNESFISFDNAASSSLTVNEESGTLSIPVNLTTPQNSDMTINYSVNPLTAAAGVDYNSSSSSITIPAGEVEGIITVNIIDNSTLDPNKTFEVRLTGTSDPNFKIGLSGQEATFAKVVTIVNDDDGCTTRGRFWLGPVSAEDVGYATITASGARNASNTCNLIVFSGDIAGIGGGTLSPLSFVFVPSAPGATSGTITVARQTYSTITGDAGSPYTYEASGTYNELTKTIQVNYTVRTAAGAVFYPGSNIIRKL